MGKKYYLNGASVHSRDYNRGRGEDRGPHPQIFEDEDDTEALKKIFTRSRTRRGEEFSLIPRLFRGRGETLENLCDGVIMVIGVDGVVGVNGGVSSGWDGW